MSKFVHYELNTSDPKKAKKFYAGLFGWKYEDMPMPGGVYTMVMTKDGPLGGIQKHPMKGAPSHWLAYASVDSIDASSKKVKKLGGSVIVPKMVIENVGEFAVYADPTGATFACWKELAHAKPAKKASKKKRAAKKSAKKATKKKRAAKKSTKKATKKRAAKKATKKKRAAKKSTKKATKKRAAKKTAKKTAKKATKKRAAKKATKKRAAKKTAKKTPKKATKGGKKAAKKSTKKRASKRKR